MTEPRRLAQYVQPELSEARITRQWAAVRDGSPRGLVRRYGPIGAMASVVVVALFVSYWHVRANNAEVPVFVIERTANGEGRASLPEGIKVGIAKEGKLELRNRSASEVVLGLVRGEADFEVTHREGRRVVVATPRFDIEVVGTSFHVAVTGSAVAPEVAVQVRRGTVKVRSNVAGADSVTERRISAGETWSSGAMASTAVSVAPTVVASAMDKAALPSVPQLVEPAPSRASAKEFIEAAERHRSAGRLREAAAALDAIRRYYPGDSRAPLAAFELGRIRMDGLGDYVGALSALESALSLNPKASFREDAEARRVKLYDRMGQTVACKKARQSYLARYPQGNHVNAMGNACGQ